MSVLCLTPSSPWLAGKSSHIGPASVVTWPFLSCPVSAPLLFFRGHQAFGTEGPHYCGVTALTGSICDGPISQRGRVRRPRGEDRNNCFSRDTVRPRKASYSQVSVELRGWTFKNIDRSALLAPHSSKNNSRPGPRGSLRWCLPPPLATPLPTPFLAHARSPPISISRAFQAPSPGRSLLFLGSGTRSLQTCAWLSLSLLPPQGEVWRDRPRNSGRSCRAAQRLRKASAMWQSAFISVSTLRVASQERKLHEGRDFLKFESLADIFYQFSNSVKLLNRQPLVRWESKCYNKASREVSCAFLPLVTQFSLAHKEPFLIVF